VRERPGVAVDHEAIEQQKREMENEAGALRALMSSGAWMVLARAFEAKANTALEAAIGAQEPYVSGKCLGEFAALRDVLLFPQARLTALEMYLNPPKESAG
jgi:hypothetical protein